MLILFKYLLPAAGIFFYFFITIRYCLQFRNNILFKGKIRIVHYILFWLLPFFWIMVVKHISAKIPGSYEFPDKREPERFDNNYMNG